MTGKEPTPPRDPLIDEIREIRSRLWSDCGEDLDRVAEQLREVEERYKDRVKPPPTTADHPGRKSA